MVLGLMGRKIGMTQVFDADGIAVPVTVVKLGENIVTSKRLPEVNGYSAVQVGGFKVKESRLNSPQRGLFKKLEIAPLSPLREFRVDDAAGFTIGAPLEVETVIKEGTMVDVRGSAIGKGFQGTVKRYHAGRGPMAHGSKFHRSMGSIGAGTTPGRVLKGMNMPGRMGGKNVCSRHHKVIKVDGKNSLVLLAGGVPGVEGGIVVISPSKVRWNN